MRERQGLKPRQFWWSYVARLKPCRCYKARVTEFFCSPQSPHILREGLFGTTEVVPFRGSISEV